MKTILFCVFCEKRTFITLTAGRERRCVLAPGGGVFPIRLPYAKRVVVQLTSGNAHKTVYYHFSCPASYVLRIAFSLPKAAQQLFTLTDGTYGIPVDGTLTFAEK